MLSIFAYTKMTHLPVSQSLTSTCHISPQTLVSIQSFDRQPSASCKKEDQVQRYVCSLLLSAAPPGLCRAERGWKGVGHGSQLQS